MAQHRVSLRQKKLGTSKAMWEKKQEQQQQGNVGEKSRSSSNKAMWEKKAAAARQCWRKKLEQQQARR